jgi:glycosyltransferase involved in cell wall biosynthesis
VISVVHDGVDADPIIAAPPFTGLRRTLELADDLQIVIAVGALVEHKGHSRLVEAMQALPNHALILVGEGELRADLERQVVAAGLESRVKLLGQRADVYSLMKAADLFCHPSREEGMGQAVVEAMLAGLPVVATAVGGVPEVLRDDGVLVETGLPSDIARGISGASVLAAGPVLQRAAMRVRREYSVLQMTQGTEAAYRLILGS